MKSDGHKQHLVGSLLMFLYALHSTYCTYVCRDATPGNQGTQSGTRIQANVIYISTPHSLPDCIKQCLTRADCKVLSYHKDKLLCELGRNANDVMTSPDFITINMNNWIPPYNVVGVCAGHGCKAGSVCVSMTTGGYQCITENTGYTSDNRFTGILHDDAVNVTVTSFTECLSVCQVLNCVSFFYGEGHCKRYSRRLFSKSRNKTPGWRYFERTGTLGNLALGKPTLEISAEVTNTGADLSAASTVDGNRYPTTYTIGRACFMSLPTISPWMSVDLVETYFIQEVAILTRRGQDSCFEDVQVLSGLQISDLSVCGYINGLSPQETFISVTCNEIRPVRYIRLMSVALFDGRFAVCELEVYGYL